MGVTEFLLQLQLWPMNVTLLLDSVDFRKYYYFQFGWAVAIESIVREVPLVFVHIEVHPLEKYTNLTH